MAGWYEQQRVRRRAAIERAELRRTAIVHPHPEGETLWQACDTCGKEVYHTTLAAHRFREHHMDRG
jgi:hypothetical protein